jgi:hypothetical protein
MRVFKIFDFNTLPLQEGSSWSMKFFFYAFLGTFYAFKIKYFNKQKGAKELFKSVQGLLKSSIRETKSSMLLVVLTSAFNTLPCSTILLKSCKDKYQ